MAQREKAQSTNRVSLSNPARDSVRKKLLAAGFLVTTIQAPKDIVPLTPEEILELGRLPTGARTSEELLNEDRDTR